MKPSLLKVPSGPACSFSIRQDHLPYINNRWHYHSEIELIHFKQGSGTQFIGDNVKRFHSGDVVLIGPNIPHYWNFDDVYFSDDNTVPDIRVVHFTEDFWGKQFLELPENQAIKNILKKSRRGLQITGRTKVLVAGIMEKMLNAQGTNKIILLLDALNVIASDHDATVLSSFGFKHDTNVVENDRIDGIYQYSIQNYKKKIQMKEIAAVANMSPNSFCRYFKSKTRKTYSAFLTEVRVGVACKLLLENRIGIKQICYESGFHNFASFHKYFKRITNKTPLNYQKEYLQTR